jgi:diaminohydroxyphosphoribosylaminopyrimidine deaminase / 5-amino-6-(5-phosphoribosylamino)uracil reductase
MHRALELARRGIAVTSPNPAVGCVILDRAGQVAGEGWHEYDLVDHAEVVALNVAKQHAGERLKGGTAYVTLEPCNHTGRTPPCTDALIASGVHRVVAATIDPNPAVAGHGMDKLSAAGIQVTLGPCQPEARRLNEGFARWSQHKRPLVLMKVAMTLDGRIAHPSASTTLTSPSGSPPRKPAPPSSPSAGRPTPPSPASTPSSPTTPCSPTAAACAAAARSSASSSTPPSACPSTAKWSLARKTMSSSSPSPRTRPASSNFSNAASASKSYPPKQGRVPLAKVLNKLGEEGILTLLTETGTRLNTALLAAGLVDRVHLFVSPQIMGSDAVPAFRGMAHPIRMAEVEVERYANDLGLCSLLKTRGLGLQRRRSNPRCSRVPSP